LTNDLFGMAASGWIGYMFDWIGGPRHDLRGAQHMTMISPWGKRLALLICLTYPKD